MTEITIEVRKNGTLSIQADAIGRDTESTKTAESILRRALLKIQTEAPDDVYRNEIIFYVK